MINTCFIAQNKPLESVPKMGIKKARWRFVRILRCVAHARHSGNPLNLDEA